jgi:hypothetical protein
VKRCVETISEVAHREIDGWPVGSSFQLAPRQRVVLEAIARRTDLVAADLTPEPARMRDVTMIPRGGCQVTVANTYAA